MPHVEDIEPDAEGAPECDCGYRGRAVTLDARVRDAQQHAAEVHGIEVSPEQVLAEGGSSWT